MSHEQPTPHTNATGGRLKPVGPPSKHQLADRLHGPANRRPVFIDRRTWLPSVLDDQPAYNTDD